MTPDEAYSTPPAESGRGRRGLRTVGLHLLALACFTVPAIVLWWHVWSGHPSSALTCGCGDPAQEVWFMAWPAWAVGHLHSVVFSGAVNVPHGANLLSNTSGPLVGVVLAPVTWLFGPVTATNAALTLAPALSAWACFAAARPLVRWKAGAIPAALVFGYSAALVTSLTFGHVSVSILVIPPFLFTTLHEIVIRQEHSVRRDGLLLAALLVVQFFISPEILVMCLVLTSVGLLAVMVVGWRQLRSRAGHALPALALGGGVTVLVLAYPAWYGLAGPQAVTGVLFALAPISGVPLSGLLVPGAYGAPASEFIRFGGYLGCAGPPPDYVGWGVALAGVGAAVVGRRRPLTWLLLLLAAATFWLALGAYLISGPAWLGHPWLPWRQLSVLPVLKEILPDQFVPLVTLFLAFLLAVGLDAVHGAFGRPATWMTRHRAALTGIATLAVAVVALAPVLTTFDAPLRVVRVHTPPYLRDAASRPPAGSVVLTVPFAVTGSTQPMLWQAMQGMRFRLAGGALKTPDAQGGPVGTGAPGSARRILTDLTITGPALPAGTPAQLATVRTALQSWRVDQVVITGASRDPVYASGFLTAALGAAPVFERRAWVWKVQPGQALAPPVTGTPLSTCRVYAATPGERRKPMTMARCVLFAGGRAA
ncbi:MAG TPA: hypothetical protein VHX67_07385 [Acidimicrobiales bacterium]|nr:hypothetical protein [Acidimicrobiales bacterium]